MHANRTDLFYTHILGSSVILADGQNFYRFGICWQPLGMDQPYSIISASSISGLVAKGQKEMGQLPHPQILACQK